MFINKSEQGLNNVCGKKILNFRKELGLSQRELADKLQLIGLDVDKNAFRELNAARDLLLTLS